VATEIGFFPYDPGFTGGVEVAVGNFDGDPGGHAEIAVGAGPGGGPHIRVFRYVAGAPGGVADFGVSFFPYDPGFVGGVHLAAGDVDGDGRAELVTGTGVGGGPHVRVFRAPGGGPPTELGGFFAYSPAFRGGVWVGVAGAQIVTGAGPGGGAHVRGFSPAGTPTALNVIAY
jgi:serralysin